MNTSSNKKSFIGSKTFIIFTVLASIFFVLFLYSVINMGIRYDFFSKTIKSESDLVWKFFLSDSSKWTALAEEHHVALDSNMINSLNKYTTNMNLTYTIMTIVFVFGFVITAFVPLAYWMCKLSEKRAANKLLKKQMKLEKSSIVQE